MPSYPTKISIAGPEGPDGESHKEIDVAGQIEWDDHIFVIRRATGETLFEAPTGDVYKSIDVLDLYALEPELSLSSPAFELQLQVARKERPGLLRAMRSLVEVAASADADFRHQVEAEAGRVLGRGTGCLLSSLAAALVLIGALWLSTSRSVIDFLYFALFGAALTTAVSASLIRSARRLRRVARGHSRP